MSCKPRTWILAATVTCAAMVWAGGPLAFADGGPPRQGGDTCATAAVIPALPFTDTGTTVGYTNDYDEVCPYPNSTSPDVVYRYDPPTSVTVEITLCVGETDYDTKLYVYQDACPGTVTGCNDDACSSPHYPAYVS